MHLSLQIKPINGNSGGAILIMCSFINQFLGKDNVAYHTAIFPGTQIGTRDAWTKLHHLSTTEYLTYEGGKFSKSRGIGVFGDSAQKTGVTSDVCRYYLISHRPDTGDRVQLGLVHQCQQQPPTQLSGQSRQSCRQVCQLQELQWYCARLRAIS